MKPATTSADAVLVGAAFAVREPADRPGWLERVLVLAICAGLIAGLAVLDERGAHREITRAHEVIAERAQAPPTTAPAPALRPAPALAVTTGPSRDDGPLTLLLMAAVGLSMAGGGLRLISRRSA